MCLAACDSTLCMPSVQACFTARILLLDPNLDTCVSARGGVQNQQEGSELERSGTRHKLVLQQLSAFEDDVVLYKNIGKAYVCTPKKAIIDRFDHELKEIAGELESTKAKKQRVATAVESAENEFTEFLTSHPAVAQAFMAGGGML